MRTFSQAAHEKNHRARGAPETSTEIHAVPTRRGFLHLTPRDGKPRATIELPPSLTKSSTRSHSEHARPTRARSEEFAGAGRRSDAIGGIERPRAVSLRPIAVRARKRRVRVSDAVLLRPPEVVDVTLLRAVSEFWDYDAVPVAVAHRVVVAPLVFHVSVERG